jgi:immune inhibitor A
MNVFAPLLPILLLVQQYFVWSDTTAFVPPTPPVSAEEAIQQAELPWRDLQDLVVRVKGVSPDAAHASTAAPEGGRRVGERATFWVADESNDTYLTVSTTLKVVTPHAYMYLADDAKVDQATLEQAAKVFEDKVYAGDRGYFGDEPAVGLDGDAHVSIVNADIPGLGGYFTSVDEYPRSVHPYSNERKAIYINVAAAPAGSSTYYGILAHEFEHMIQWNTNRVEESWVKEGSAQVATEAANLGGNSGAVRAFEARPDTQLNSWSDSKSGDVLSHYGAAYLFISYFLQHFGGYSSGADLLSGDTKGPDSFDRFLSTHGYQQTFDDVFDDWTVANYLDESGTKDPRYLYTKVGVQVPATDELNGATSWQDRTVHQFASDYLELSGSWSGAKLHFQGDQATRVIAPRAHSGNSFWWSNRGDLIDTRLTRVFDLRNQSTATMNFWAWYDLEDGYDYAYVMISRDGGATWTTLKAADTTDANPNGNNLGNGFTGKSGGNDAQWKQESVDLTPYVGDTVLVRFEQVTDDAYNAPGFAVDDISVPELGYSTDAESDDGGWLPTGFVRTDGQLSQRFSLQLIKFGDQITVEHLQLPASESMDVDIPNPDGKLHRAVLVVSALTRHTTEPAHYRYSVETAP